MGSLRFIHPKVWTSSDFTALSMTGRVLWFGLISIADDWGRLKYDVDRIRRQVFPDDDVKNRIIQELLVKMETRKMLLVYDDGNGQQLIWLPTFREHQPMRYRGDSSLVAHLDDPDPEGRKESSLTSAKVRKVRTCYGNIPKVDAGIGVTVPAVDSDSKSPRRARKRSSKTEPWESQAFIAWFTSIADRYDAAKDRLGLPKRPRTTSTLRKLAWLARRHTATCEPRPFEHWDVMLRGIESRSPPGKVCPFSFDYLFRQEPQSKVWNAERLYAWGAQKVVSKGKGRVVTPPGKGTT